MVTKPSQPGYRPTTGVLLAIVSYFPFVLAFWTFGLPEGQPNYMAGAGIAVFALVLWSLSVYIGWRLRSVAVIGSAALILLFVLLTLVTVP